MKALFMLLLFVVTANAQFKYLGDSLWQTDTKTVMKIRQSYNDLTYYKSATDSLKDVVKAQQQINDSTQKQIARLQHIDTLHKEREEQLSAVIIELTKPVIISVPNKIIQYEGTFLNVGIYNDFTESSFTNGIRPRAKLEPTLLFFDRIRFGAELIYKPIPLINQKPWEVTLNVGIRAF